MSMFQTKGLPLTKEEVMLLVNLIESNSIVTSKATNASNNRLKEEAWAKITDHFNSLVKSTPRAKQQLRLKWENLKKSARKRITAKISGGNPENFPPDDALDKVASMLGVTCGGYAVSFGADSVHVECKVEKMEEIDYSDEASNSLGACAEGYGIGTVPDCNQSDEFTTSNVAGATLTPEFRNTTPQPKNGFYSSSNSVGKHSLERESQSRSERNFAIAEYYRIKKQGIEDEVIANRNKLKLEIELLQMQKRKLELEVLELENKSKLEKNGNKKKKREINH